MRKCLLSAFLIVCCIFLDGVAGWRRLRYPGLVGRGNTHGFTGQFFCKQYQNSRHLNKWHYVDIVHVENDTFKWTNKAGVSWNLTYLDSNTLAVGRDCPYYWYPHNHREVKYTDDYVEGPHEEKYFRTRYSKKFTGHFVNNQYKPNWNNWHFVEISYIGDDTYRWTNRARATWTLKSKDSNVLDVQPNCPYFKSGHTQCTFTDNYLKGPSNEQYDRQDNPYTGRFFCEKYRNSEHLNNWHYVDITFVGGNRYRWTNKAGVSWTLTSNGSNNSPKMLDVGKDCPYFEKFGNHKKLKYSERYDVVFGPGGEKYVRQR